MIIEEEIFGIKHVRKFYGNLKEEYKSGIELIIDFKSVKRVDLSIVQVLTAVVRMARKDGRVVKFKSLSEDVKNQMILCGLKI